VSRALAIWIAIAVSTASLATALASIPKHVPQISQAPIRVRVAEGASVVNVGGYDLRLYTNAGARRLASVADRQTSWELRCEDGRVRARRVSGGGVGETTLDLAEPVVIQSPAGFLQYNGRPYREELRVYSAGSLCEVVNQVDIEKYLEGLVNAEFNSRWSEEAIGAQVVAARTYAVFQMRQAQDQHYDVDATTHDQVYDGSMKEDSRAARIVEKTRGLLLTVKTAHGVEPLKAYYHSTCGGVTELPEKVWGTSNQGFRRVVCPFCAHSPGSHWSFDLTSGAIVEALRREAANHTSAEAERWPSNWRRLLGAGRLQGLRIGGLDPSGRVDQVVMTFDLDHKTQDWTMTGAKFRQWVGPARFKSTAFQMQLASALSGGGLTWRFSGKGNGHGVGMCQWGAKSMGEHGYKTAAILKFYYPDAAIKKFW
jgi:stage II sporulation protein D